MRGCFVYASENALNEAEEEMLRRYAERYAEKLASQLAGHLPTVKYLTETLHYSTATINRDLNTMEKQNLVKRSYGGAELAEQKVIPLFFRYSKMRPVKNKIAKKAADFVKDGDTIFIDCSTTAQYMGEKCVLRPFWLFGLPGFERPYFITVSPVSHTNANRIRSAQ